MTYLLYKIDAFNADSALLNVFTKSKLFFIV